MTFGRVFVELYIKHIDFYSKLKQFFIIFQIKNNYLPKIQFVWEIHSVQKNSFRLLMIRTAAMTATLDRLLRIFMPTLLVKKLLYTE